MLTLAHSQLSRLFFLALRRLSTTQTPALMNRRVSFFLVDMHHSRPATFDIAAQITYRTSHLHGYEEVRVDFGIGFRPDI
jgi:hypothetical protein